MSLETMPFWVMCCFCLLIIDWVSHKRAESNEARLKFLEDWVERRLEAEIARVIEEDDQCS